MILVHKKIYETFDKLIQQREEIISEAAQRQEEIHSQICEANTKYSRDFDWLEPFCPSLIIDKITGGYHKGRLVRKKPNSAGYTVCYFNEQNRLLFFQKYNEYGCSLNMYFFEKNGVQWAVPFSGDNSFIYSTYLHRMLFDKDRIQEYTYLDEISFWHENYTYESEGQAICMNYSYVPNLTGSSKTILPGFAGSPIEVWKAELLLQKNRVKELRYFSLKDGEESLIFQYKRKNEKS